MEPVVSVIIPVYNAEKFLRKCLDSVLAQTLENIEIICIDDGSGDSSPAILSDYAHKDARLRVIRQENRGAGAARNRGLAEAKGMYLSFLDADDFFEKDMLHLAVQTLEKQKSDYVVFGCDRYLDTDRKFEKADFTIRKEALPFGTLSSEALSSGGGRTFTWRDLTDNVFKVFMGWAWDKVYRREFVLANHLTFQEQRTSNDLLFVFSALLKAEKIGCLPDILVHQRQQYEGSLSHTREVSWRCFYDALLALDDFITNHLSACDAKELRKDFCNYALHLSLWHFNTLTGDARQRTYDLLRDEGFRTLGILDLKEEEFEDRRQYRELKKIMAQTFEEYPVELSVVIPVHNAQCFIRETLDSILTVRSVPLEVICVDDHSTDATGEILAEYQKQYDNVRVLTNEENIFAGESRNRGLLAARGRYVHFLDADDLAAADAYPDLLCLALENDLDWLKARAEAFDDATGKKVNKPLYSLEWMARPFDETLLNFTDYPRKFMYYLSFVPWNGIYKRAFLLENNIRFNRLFCVNDRSFFVECCIRGKRMMVTRRKTIARHRMNLNTSLVGSRLKHFDCQYESYRIMKRLCDENHVSDRVRFEILDQERNDMTAWHKRRIEYLGSGPEAERAEEEFERFIKEEADFGDLNEEKEAQRKPAADPVPQKENMEETAPQKENTEAASSQKAGERKTETEFLEDLSWLYSLSGTEQKQAITFLSRKYRRARWLGKVDRESLSEPVCNLILFLILDPEGFLYRFGRGSDMRELPADDQRHYLLAEEEISAAEKEAYHCLEELFIRPNLWKDGRYTYSQILFKGYLKTLENLGDGYKKEFIKRIRKALEMAGKGQYLREDDFLPEEYKKLKSIQADPENFYRETLLWNDPALETIRNTFSYKASAAVLGVQENAKNTARNGIRKLRSLAGAIKRRL